ncbi:hypothetical protein L4C33_21915, partial [Vibrio makurazakiensis]|uniref:hypothetical protein n=1 Tax=Vibrio makurazakiensis TaxID=2910250 RepID=UPI003D09BD08
LRADGGVNLQEGAQLCWEVNDAGTFETACLGMALNAAGEVTLAVTAADATRVQNNRRVNVEIENIGGFIHQNEVGVPRITAMEVRSVSTGDFVPEPTCPAGFNIRIAASLSTVTDVDAAVLPANNWGDNRNSAPDLGESSEIGAVGVGWDQVAGGWNITSNVMSRRLNGGNQASGSRFNISTWCEE